jgi:hypothetical protein
VYTPPCAAAAGSSNNARRTFAIFVTLTSSWLLVVLFLISTIGAVQFYARTTGRSKSKNILCSVSSVDDALKSKPSQTDIVG